MLYNYVRIKKGKHLHHSFNYLPSLFLYKTPLNLGEVLPTQFNAPKLNHVAQISQEGKYLVWGEDDNAGEMLESEFLNVPPEPHPKSPKI